MAYKLLNSMLPLDIVKQIIDYGHNDNMNKFHLIHLYNCRKLMNLYMYIRIPGVKVNSPKNFTYAETDIYCTSSTDLKMLKKIIKIVPSDIELTIYNMRKNIKKYIIKCNICSDPSSLILDYCLYCDYSGCTSDLIFAK